MATEAQEAETHETGESRVLVKNGVTFLQAMFGVVAMVAYPEHGASLGRGFFLTTGAMMIVGALGIGMRERWGWTIAAVFDVLYVAVVAGIAA